MVYYWEVRRKNALEDSRKAATSEIRDVYLQLADHYQAMARFSLPSSQMSGARSARIWL